MIKIPMHNCPQEQIGSLIWPPYSRIGSLRNVLSPMMAGCTKILQITPGEGYAQNRTT